jgi:hypothetical protein
MKDEIKEDKVDNLPLKEEEKVLSGEESYGS